MRCQPGEQQQSGNRLQGLTKRQCYATLFCKKFQLLNFLAFQDSLNKPDDGALRQQGKV
jgi:hypothetical protein